MNFRCNYRKCRKELAGSALVTSCSHIFCFEHNPSKIGIEMNNTIKRKEVKCPVCKSSLNQAFGFVEVELEPPDAFKGMVLTGLRPETIIEISARALGFWMYQMEQELQYNQYIIRKQSEKAKTMEMEFINAYNSLNDEKNYLKAEKENLSKECEELREKLIVESRNIEKMTAELKYHSLREEDNRLTAFNIVNQPGPINDKLPFNFRSLSAGKMDERRFCNLNEPRPPSMGTDSSFGSPNKFVPRKSEHANRVWGISANQYSRPLMNFRNIPQTQHNGRKYLSPLDNILNKKSEFTSYQHRRLPNSVESISSSQLSYGVN